MYLNYPVLIVNSSSYTQVAKGVIFNNLEHIMDTHINSMLVLRPGLSNAERANFLVWFVIKTSP